MKKQRSSKSKAALWRKRSDDVLTSDVVASRHPGPVAPAEWRPVLTHLTELSRSPVPCPNWWTPATAFFGSIETRTDPASYHWDGMKRLARLDQPLAIVQFTLAGWGHFQNYGQRPQRIVPGKGFVAIVPSRHRYYLPKDSPGWTFGWFCIYHPYVLARIRKQVVSNGPLLEMPPDSAVTASALRLVRGAIKKDFRDRFEVELALFEFVLAYERWAQQSTDSSGEGERLLHTVRSRIVASLPAALSVDVLAAEHGMSRSHFSHYFRSRTGLTPAHFATEVRIHEAARMLIDTSAPIKRISTACGFANVNHFSRVFRRFQLLSPAAYRRAIL